MVIHITTRQTQVQETLVKRPGEARKEEKQRKNKLFKKTSQRQGREGHLDN